MQTVAKSLAHKGIPATFFILAGEIGSEELHPDHRLYYLLNQTTQDQSRRAFQALFPGSSTLPPTNASPREVRKWLESSLGCSVVSETGRNALDALEQELGGPTSRGMGNALYMTSDQVRSLPACGIQVGNHTMSHRALSTLNEIEQRAEIEDGQRLLSGLIQRPVTTFAYPYGQCGDFEDASARIATELGHSHACTAIRGYNDAGTDPMRLHRIHAAPFSGQELAFHLLWPRTA